MPDSNSSAPKTIAPVRVPLPAYSANMTKLLVPGSARFEEVVRRSNEGAAQLKARSVVPAIKERTFGVELEACVVPGPSEATRTLEECYEQLRAARYSANDTKDLTISERMACRLDLRRIPLLEEVGPQRRGTFVNENGWTQIELNGPVVTRDPFTALKQITSQFIREGNVRAAPYGALMCLAGIPPEFPSTTLDERAYFPGKARFIEMHHATAHLLSTNPRDKLIIASGETAAKLPLKAEIRITNQTFDVQTFHHDTLVHHFQIKPEGFVEPASIIGGPALYSIMNGFQLHLGNSSGTKEEATTLFNSALIANMLTLGISANSPFFCGQSTGLKCTRTFLQYLATHPDRTGPGLDRWMKDPSDQMNYIIHPQGNGRGTGIFMDPLNSGKSDHQLTDEAFALQATKNHWPWVRLTPQLHPEIRGLDMLPTVADTAIFGTLVLALTHALPRYFSEEWKVSLGESDRLEQFFPFKAMVQSTYNVSAFGQDGMVFWRQDNKPMEMRHGKLLQSILCHTAISQSFDEFGIELFDQRVIHNELARYLTSEMTPSDYVNALCVPTLLADEEFPPNYTFRNALIALVAEQSLSSHATLAQLHQMIEPQAKPVRSTQELLSHFNAVLARYSALNSQAQDALEPPFP